MRNAKLRAAFLSPRTYALVLAGALGLVGGSGAALLTRTACAQEEGAQAEPVRRQHPELVYAQTLAYTYNYWDLAVEVLDSLEKTRPSADVMADLKLARLDIQLAEVTDAGFKGDANQRKEILGKVRKDLEDLAKREGDAGVQARLKLGEMLLQEGDGAVARMRNTDDADARQQAHKEAEEKYQAGQKYFEEIQEAFQKACEKADDEYAKINGNATNPDDPALRAAGQKQLDAYHRLCIARYNAACAQYNIALLYESGAKDRLDRITKCRQLFEDINLEFSNDPLGSESAIRLGLCEKELGNVQKAATAFEAALGIKAGYAPDEQGRYNFDPMAQDVVSRACYFKAQMLNEVRDWDGAINAVKDLFDLMPALAKSPLGFAARIEQAKAIGGKGEAKKAQEQLEKISEEAKGTYWAQAAKEAIALLSGSAGGMAVAPDKALNNAKIAIANGKIAEGLNALRILIAQVEQASPEDQKKWLPMCWLELGKAYLEEGRFDEAAAAFDALVTRTKDEETSPQALFQEAMAYLQVNGLKNNEYDDKAYTTVLQKLQKDYPKDDYAKASSFFLGIKFYSAREYVAAAKEFEKTGPTAKKLYDASLYQAGLSYIMEGRRLASDKEGKKDEAGAKAMFAQAQVSLKKAIDWATEGAFTSGVPKDGDRAATLKKLAFDSRCRLAEVFGHPLIKDADKALAAAQEAEQGLGAGADPDRIAEARSLAVSAFLLADKAEKAEEIVASMGKDCPKAVRTAGSEREVAGAFDRLAEGLRKTDMEKAKPFYRKAADHLTSWLELSLAADIDVGGRDGGRDLSRAGDKFMIYAKVLNGLDDEKISSFVEVEDLTKLPDAKRFLTAAKAYIEVMKTPAGDWKVGIKLGEAYGFARDFQNAKKLLYSVCEAEKLLIVEKEKDEKGKDIAVTNIDVKVARANLFLLFAYSDYARACLELVLSGQDRSLLDEAINAAARIVQVSTGGQESWWRGKYIVLAALYEKGEYGDASLGIRQIERQNPNFDGGKYHLQDKFLALKEKLKGKSSPGATPPPKGGAKSSK